MTRDQLVAVKWKDPKLDQGNTYTREEIKASQPKVFTTIGLLIRDDETEVAVANEVADDGSFRGVTHILRPLVQHIEAICAWPKPPRRVRSVAAPAPAPEAPPAAAPAH